MGEKNINGRILKLGDTVYYKNSAMTYERDYVPPTRYRNTSPKIYCSWINKDTGKKEEGIFDISELTTVPKE